MGGHEIKKIRKLQERELTGQKIEWAFNNKRVREILLLAFPNLNINEAQRRKAGRWARVIYLYYRMGLPRQIIEKETRMSEGALKTLLRNINRVAQGLRADGTGKRACHTSSSLRGSQKEGEKSECRVHSCVFQQRVVAKKAQPNPLRSCSCRRVVSQAEADQLVKYGEANLLVVAREKKTVSKACKICDGGDTKTSCSFCGKTGKMLVTDISEIFGRDLVLIVHKTKTVRVSTPRVPKIEAKHILRAYTSNESRALVAEAARTSAEDEFSADEFKLKRGKDDAFAFTPLGYVSPAQQEQAQQRINEYGLMILEARAFPGPSECKHREEFKCSRCEVPIGQKLNVIGQEPKDNQERIEGRTFEWGRVI